MQTKLAVSEPGDALEQEADRIAAQVTTVPHAADTSPRITPLRSTVPQKKAATGDEPVAEELRDEEAVPGTGGRTLAPSERAFFEPRFGRDLGRVRVHTDAQAARSAESLGALAYTAGEHIVFAAGRYRPDTDQGRRLLAHELVHTVQQSPRAGGRPALIQRQVPQGQTGQQTQQQQGAGTGQQAQPQAAPPRSPCDLAIDDIVNEARPLLQDAVQQLQAYEPAQRAVEAGGQPTPEVTRVATALEYNFHTRSSGYATIIRERLQGMEQRLGTRANLTLSCAAPNDPECAVVSFGHSTVAHVPDIGQVVLCSTGTPGNRPTYTFIHELAHAIMPNLGGLTTPTSTAETPTDRAYEFQRIYRFLSPEEALDNAESYGLLVQHLVARQTTPAATPYNDSMTGCTDAASVNVAVARAEDWNLIAARWTQSAVNLVQQSGSPLAQADAARITPHFTGTGLADLRRLQANYQAIADSYNQSVDVRCATSSPSCAGGALGWGRNKSVTDSAVRNAASAGPDFFINLCPAWFAAGPETRIRSIYALYILSRPNHLINVPLTNVLIRRDQAYDYVDLARDLYGHVRPPPRAQFLMEHQLADMRVQLARIQAELDDIQRRLDALGVDLQRLRREIDESDRRIDRALHH